MAIVSDTEGEWRSQIPVPWTRGHWQAQFTKHAKKRKKKKKQNMPKHFFLSFGIAASK